MHTFEYHKGGLYPIRFHYNSDLSGDLIITKGDQALELPFKALAEFYFHVSDTLQGKAIANESVP